MGVLLAGGEAHISPSQGPGPPLTPRALPHLRLGVPSEGQCLPLPHQELISRHFGEDGTSYEAEIRELADLRQVGRPAPPTGRPARPVHRQGSASAGDSKTKLRVDVYNAGVTPLGQLQGQRGRRQASTQDAMGL